MIAVSTQLQSLCGRCYTFSTVALGLKYLTASGISISDVTIALEDRKKLVGAVALATLAIALTSLVCLVRDGLAYSMAAPDVGSDPNISNVGRQVGGESRTVAERHAGKFVFVSYLLFVISSVMPIVYGVISFVLCLPEVSHAIASLRG